MKIDENKVAARVVDTIRGHVGKKKLDLSIAQVKLVQRAVFEDIATYYKISEIVALIEKHSG
jgi:hypothetical protein